MNTLFTEVRAVVPTDWEVSTRAPRGYVYICPPAWAYRDGDSPCIFCSGSNVSNLEQVRACLKYWESTSTDRQDYQQFVKNNKGERGLLPGNLRDKVRHLKLPVFN